MAHYKYEVTGINGAGNKWTVEGTVGGGNYMAAHEQVLREMFQKLTEGRAVFGNPGKWGCHGPYRITAFHVEELLQ